MHTRFVKNNSVRAIDVRALERESERERGGEGESFFHFFGESVDDTLVLATNEKEPFAHSHSLQPFFQFGAEEKERKRERSCIIQVCFWKVE